jgi:hypothetical protein
MKDEIETIPQKPDACETRTPHKHQIMFKTLENPLRRKIIKSIESLGKTKQKIIEELNLSESQLKFQLDFLVKMCYAEVDGGNCKLNSKGLELLKNVR